MSKDQTSDALGRVSFTASPETLGAKLHDSLRLKNKHARANEIQRLLVLGFTYEQMLHNGNIAVSAAVPAVAVPEKTTVHQFPTPDRVEEHGETDSSGLGGDLVEMFKGSLSLA